MGKSPLENDPDTYDKMNQYCDLLVVGAGPAGLMAALTAGRAGKRVILADEQSEMGGSLLCSTQSVGGMPAADWAAQAVAGVGDG